MAQVCDYIVTYGRETLPRATRASGALLVPGPRMVLRRARAKSSPALPRIVDLVGEGPFEAFLAWTGTDGKGGEVEISVPRATRVCVVAGTTLDISAASLITGQDQEVTCSVADGVLYTRNVRHFFLTSAAPEVDVPPYAIAVSGNSTDPATAAVVELVDGSGAVSLRHPMGSGGTSGIPLGASRKVSVTGLVPAELCSLHFELSL
ncbi:hypothetical protein L6R50_08880 [Myxococcota bacterium]|nr:hypothetical protein [Myxococcota bacterium]